MFFVMAGYNTDVIFQGLRRGRGWAGGGGGGGLPHFCAV